MELKDWLWTIFVIVTTFDSACCEPESVVKKKYLFHIPWACSIMHYPADECSKCGTLIGACAIIEANKVLVSVDNFNEELPNDPSKRFYEVITEIFVNAGTNYMEDRGLKQTPSYFQTKKAKDLVVPKKSPEEIGLWLWSKNPSEISEKSGVDFDAFGLAFNIGILYLAEPFTRSVYVLPMLIKGPSLERRTEAFKKKLEQGELSDATCITYSWNRKLNRIRYHEVIYLPTTYCQLLFCHWRLSKCTFFPRKNHLICFKSVKYVDVCPNARGAALYCPSFDNSVFAILTTAPSCGLRNMPGVYTTLPMVISLFEESFSTKFHLENRTQYDLFSLPQMNADYEGIL